MLSQFSRDALRAELAWLDDADALRAWLPGGGVALRRLWPQQPRM